MATIVKVQFPVSHFPLLKEDEAPALVYAKGGRNAQQLEITDELRGHMAGRLKAFFFADQDEQLNWVIVRPAPWQSW